MDALPIDLQGPENQAHWTAVERAKETTGHLKKAIDCLSSAMDEKLPPPLRGGHLRAGDQYLDMIIQCVTEAKQGLRAAHNDEAARLVRLTRGA